jgi:hypothetical protein
MIKFKVSPKNFEVAQKRARNIGANASKIKGGSEIYGMIGEQLFLDNYGGDLVDSRNYDIWHPKIGNIDVKTKKCQSEPLPHYQCSVAAYQIDKEDVEFYAFYRVHASMKEAWFLGLISKADFLKKAVLLKKGQKDDRFTAIADCYNIAISDLPAVSEVMAP